MSLFGPSVDAAAKAHALALYPREACGIVVAGAFVPLDNKAADQENFFKLPDDALVAHGKVQAVVHSHCHPRHGPSPSASDMAAQIEAALPFGIVWNDGKVAGDPIWFGDILLDQPLFDDKGNHIPRKFLHGVNDCYSLVRAWFWQIKKVKLPDFPRNADWWQTGGDLYRQGFGKAGFKALATGPNAPAGIVPGDCVLMKWSTWPVPFHAAIIVEKGLILHHPGSDLNRAPRLSRREPLGNWTRHVTHWLRHEDASA